MTGHKLSFVYIEPDGWPLTRAASDHEWTHVVKLMIMRRVPRTESIHRRALADYVMSDLIAASISGRLYVEGHLRLRPILKARHSWTLIELMCIKDKTLNKDARGRICRSEFAEGWLVRVPATVKAVEGYLPTTHVLDLMVQALVDDDQQCQ